MTKKYLVHSTTSKYKIKLTNTYTKIINISNHLATIHHMLD